MQGTTPVAARSSVGTYRQVLHPLFERVHVLRFLSESGTIVPAVYCES